ncbi:MAG TPA: N-(5'-phosphoribosyl)anthranilate isomerase, partial [Candidatus Desulfofervidus auxilii]|nr:N-(5'-phosphoribosyl)anthranilate isomerase [Candidatus Desulfofervidus auxilii]
WELAIKAKVYNVPIILAGGLAPDNIKRAVEIVQPYALDVNSGIEKIPGIKDKKLMEKLFAVWSKI